jgi:hypothetical protein
MTLQNAENFTVFFGADFLEKIKALPRSLSGLPFKRKAHRSEGGLANIGLATMNLQAGRRGPFPLSCFHAEGQRRGVRS